MEQHLEGSGDNWEGPDAIMICSQYLKYSSNCRSFFELKESPSYNAHIISKQYLEGGATYEGLYQGRQELSTRVPGVPHKPGKLKRERGG